MKTINYEERYTKDEVIVKIASMVARWGANQSIDKSGMSYRKEGIPGTGGGTIAISYGLPVYRKGIAYYKELNYAS